MICPFCKSKNVREIIYGEIGFRDEQDLAEFEKNFYNIDPASAQGSGEAKEKYHCDGCGKKFAGRARGTVKKGMRVAIVLKKDQPTGKLTEGIVKDILTSDSFHPRGVKVRLEDGQVGRVQRII
jgi:uncharacterized repeat protein (TIGR03833 family)